MSKTPWSRSFLDYQISREDAHDYRARPDIPDGYTGWIAHAQAVHRGVKPWGSAQFFRVDGAQLVKTCDHWTIFGCVGNAWPGGWRVEGEGYPVASGFVRCVSGAPILLTGSPGEGYALALGG